MSRMFGIDLSQGASKPSFAERDWVTSSAGVEDFLAISIEVAEGDEEIQISRAWCSGDTNSQPGHDVTRDLGLLGHRLGTEF